MVKDTMATIPITPGTPGYVEDFRYQDGGMERNIQDEFDARDDHVQVSRVVNWEIANKADYGLSGWTPTDSLLLYITSNNLFVTEGLAYIGGRRVLEGGSELFDSDNPSTDTYYVYLQYTFGDTDAYGYSTSLPTDSDTVKYLILGTADYDNGTGFWSTATDLRASNTALFAPATVSGSDAGAIFTVENTGAGLGLLVKASSVQIGQAADPQELTLYSATGEGLILTETTNSWSVVLGVDAATRLKIAGDLNVTNDITVGGAIGGVTLSGGNATADALNLRDTTDQIVLDSDGTFTGTVSMDTLTSESKTWTFPDATGTIAVTGDGGAMSVSSAGAVTHSTADPYKHVPTSGATTQILQWDSDGTAKWVTIGGDISIADGGVVTVDGAAHAHVSAQISALDVGDVTTGTFPVARGGLGVANPTDHSILVGSGSAAVTALAKGSSGQVLVSGGTGTDPAWSSSISLTSVTGGTLTSSGDANVDTSTSIKAALMLGSANASWVPAIFRGGYEFDGGSSNDWEIQSDGDIVSQTAKSPELFFTVPLPAIRGGKNLKITGTRTAMKSSGVTFGIGSVKLYGLKGTTRTLLDTGPSFMNSNGEKEDTFVVETIGGVYEIAQIEVDITGFDGTVQIGYVSVRCYYD